MGEMIFNLIVIFLSVFGFWWFHRDGWKRGYEQAKDDAKQGGKRGKAEGT